MKGIAQLDNTVEVLDFKKILRIDLIVGFEIIGRGNPINTDVKASSFSATKEIISSRKLRSKQLHGITNNLTLTLKKNEIIKAVSENTSKSLSLLRGC